MILHRFKIAAMIIVPLSMMHSPIQGMFHPSDVPELAESKQVSQVTKVNFPQQRHIPSIIQEIPASARRGNLPKTVITLGIAAGIGAGWLLSDVLPGKKDQR